MAAFNVAVTAVATQYTLHNNSSLLQGHISYVVEVSFRGANWQIEKRFNEFMNLNQQLRRQHPHANLGSVPQKRFFGR
jgi:PX domain